MALAQFIQDQRAIKRLFVCLFVYSEKISVKYLLALFYIHQMNWVNSRSEFILVIQINIVLSIIVVVLLLILFLLVIILVV